MFNFTIAFINNFVTNFSLQFNFSKDTIEVILILYDLKISPHSTNFCVEFIVESYTFSFLFVLEITARISFAQNFLGHGVI